MIDLDKEYDSDQSQAGLHTAIDRLPNLAAMGTGLLIRVSTAQQRRKSDGSQRYQRDQSRFLRDYHASTDNLILFDARGESARANASRPVFRELIDAVRGRKIFVVLVSDADRIARNDPDAEELYDALKEIGGLVVINGEIHDPANLNHRLLLRLRAVIAQYENEQRAIRSLTSKSAKARDLALPVKLATGLVWAFPDDPEFAARMEAAGLGHLLSLDSLASHRTTVNRDGKKMFVFPYPDADVEKACRLAVRWLLEEGSVRGLLDRIDSDPEWPRFGEFPAVGCWRFDPQAGDVTWKRLRNREDGRDELGPGVLYDWLGSPSVYGTYKATFPKLKQLSLAAHRLGAVVEVPDAFPSFGAPEDRRRVRELLANPDHPKIRGSWDGPRNHALARVVCCHPMPNGKSCGRKMNAMYSSARNGKHRYLSVVCDVRGHGFSLPPDVDRVVLDMLRKLFTQERLTTELARIQVDGGAQAIQLKTLEAQVRSLEDRRDYKSDMAYDARKGGNKRLTAFYEREVERLTEEMGEAEQRLADARARSRREGEVTDQEYQEILALASDLPELLRRAKAIEGKTREIVRELVREVRARRLGAHAYFIELVLHSGQSVSRTVLVKPIHVPQPIRALAYARVGRWLNPAERMHIEDEARAYFEAESLAAQLNAWLEPRLRTPWTADRVFTAALMHRPEPAGRNPGARVPAAELATRLDLTEGEVMRAGLLGWLGAAAVLDGTLCLDPTEEELHRAFPRVARRDVAREAGWAEDDVVTLRRLRKKTGWGPYRVEQVALSGGGIAEDRAGRRYTSRSAFLIPAPADLERLLRASTPAWADLKSGEWTTWARAKRRYPGVNITTFEYHTSVVRPRFGENGLRTTYVWIDRNVEQRVCKPTLPEVLSEFDRSGLSSTDFVPRREALAMLRKKFGRPCLATWKRAIARGHVREVRAQGPTSRRLIAWALVPVEVREATSYETVERFLHGTL